MRKNIMTAAAATAFAASLALATPASAAVTFNSADGTGFVGKGDVQLAFGWNNSALQKNAAGISFSYDAEDTYSGVCTWTTGEGTKGEKTHNVSHKRKTSVASNVAYDPRVKNQITGFNLTGFGATTTSGEVPVVGEACMGNPGHDGVWTSVTPISSSGGLYVTYSGTSHLLPQETAPAVV